MPYRNQCTDCQHDRISVLGFGGRVDESADARVFFIVDEVSLMQLGWGGQLGDLGQVDT